jgi:hypothetical protein
VELAQVLEGLQPVHDRHLDVEGHQVGVELRDLGQRDPPVGGRAHDLEPGVRGQDVADQPAHDDGVVDDQHSDPGHRSAFRVRDGQEEVRRGLASRGGREQAVSR